MAPYTIVDLVAVNSEGEYNADTMLWPAILRANKHSCDEGLKLLYRSNIFVFTDASVVRSFTVRYQSAAAQIQKHSFISTVPQLGGLYSRMLDNKTGPYLNMCLGSMTLLHPLTYPFRPIRGSFTSLRSLTIEFKHWQQSKEYDTEPGVPHVLTAREFIRRTELIKAACLVLGDSQPILTVGDHAMRSSDPVTLIECDSCHFKLTSSNEA